MNDNSADSTGFGGYDGNDNSADSTGFGGYDGNSLVNGNDGPVTCDVVPLFPQDFVVSAESVQSAEL